MGRDGLRNPPRRDDLCVVPPAAVEVQQAEPRHVSGPECESPATGAVAVRVRGPPRASVAEHGRPALVVGRIVGGQVDAEGSEYVAGGELPGAPAGAAGDDRREQMGSGAVVLKRPQRPIFHR